jgi:hypothetical protein
MSLGVTQLIGFGAGGVALPATISFTASAVNPANLTVYTFSGVAIGTAAANRKIVIAVCQHSTAVSGITVGGDAATVVKVSANSNNDTELWQRNAVSSGTTADIVVTFPGGGTIGIGIGVWAIYDAQDAASDTGGSAGPSDGGDPASAPLTIPAGGVALGAACNNVSGTPTTVWTNLTEVYDEQVDTNRSQSGASKAVSVAETPTITAAFTPSTSYTTGAFAAWAAA